MQNFTINNFETKVKEITTRHKSVLDILTKLQESTAKVNRAVTKSATYCGCISINASKQDSPKNITYSELSEYMKTHVEGALCDVCRDKVIQEISQNIFYLTALCNTFDIDFESMIKNYYTQLNALGKYGLL
ncbi:MAG: DUF1573 domain-containing protein [Alkaliphilus sp.]